MSWTPTKKLYLHLRVQARSRGGRWCCTPREPRRGQERGAGAGLRRLDFFLLQLFLNSSATDIVLVTLLRTAVETAVAYYTSRYAMARGHCLERVVVLAAVHASLVFRVGARCQAQTPSTGLRHPSFNHCRI